MAEKEIKNIEAERVKQILKDQYSTCTATEEQFTKLDRNLDIIEDKIDQNEIDPNFAGTFKELHAYVTERDRSSSIEEHVQLHQENIKRWVKELHHYQQASPITIDHEDAKKRGL